MALPNSQFAGFEPNGLWPTRAGLSLGPSATFLKAIIVNVDTHDQGSVAANVSEQEQVTVTGLTSDDLVFARHQAFTASIGDVGSFVSADDTLQLEQMNATASAIDRASATLFSIGFRVQ